MAATVLLQTALQTKKTIRIHVQSPSMCLCLLTRLQTCIWSTFHKPHPPTDPLRTLHFNMCATPSHVALPLVSISNHVSDKQTRPWSHFHRSAWEQLHWSTFRSHSAHTSKCPRQNELSEVFHLTISEVNRWPVAHVSDWQMNTDQDNIIQVHCVDGTQDIFFFPHKPTSNSQINLKASCWVWSVMCRTNRRIPSPYTVRKISQQESCLP